MCGDEDDGVYNIFDSEDEVSVFGKCDNDDNLDRNIENIVDNICLFYGDIGYNFCSDYTLN